MTTALVTGATAGIGAAFARQLAARGHDLVLVARDTARLEDSAGRLRATGVQVEVLPADLVTDEGCARVEQRLGEGVDLLVNNAGVGTEGTFHELPLEDEERQLRLNVRAVMRLTHAALPSMVERGSGSVVNVGSVAGLAPGPTVPGYSASKAWVINFSESLHAHYARLGVRVLAVAAGPTRTEFHDRAGMRTSHIPAGWWLSPDDVVRTALDDLVAGRSLSIRGARWKAVAAAARAVPPSVQRRLATALDGRG